ncbi:MAG: stage V sporulation protein AB [Lachnospiraceae bacterium]|nr:stage V sporulation protein AB [Lachnospiraceae bacterium]
MKIGLLALLGFSFGAFSAAGIFTVLAAVSLVPRFVGKTHTGRDVKLYENMIILGTIVGGLYSLYANRLQLWVREYIALKWDVNIWEMPYVTWLLGVLLLTMGIFVGMFVGCLALAIAEMLDSLPIFARRARLRRGAGILISSVAAGKLAGSLLYFWFERVGW